MDSIAKQALLNEYKDNLFEYLVALKLAQNCKIENEFVTSLSEDVRNMLRIQESFIRMNFPNLLRDLPQLAQAMCDKLLPFFDNNEPKSIQLIGKISGTDSDFAEADIIIQTKRTLPVSIKLSKSKAFVNTKSGGIKSFLHKYFPCQISQKLQLELNEFVDEKFHEMAFKIHEIAGMQYNMNFSEWVANGLPELPGKLEPDYREVVHSLYYQILNKLYISIHAIREHDPISFYKGLLPLIGFGNDNLIQATCFYQNTSNRYVLTDILVEESYILNQEVKQNKMGEYKKDLANFEIILPERILQIRIKPMNKFTSASFKVNCSVKKL